MRSVTYSMGVSLDGYIVGPDGGFDWSVPDPDVFRFWIDEIGAVGVHLLGRRLYETMLYWETADQDRSLDDAELEWAALWKPLTRLTRSGRSQPAGSATVVFHARPRRLAPTSPSLLIRRSTRPRPTSRPSRLSAFQTRSDP